MEKEKLMAKYNSLEKEKNSLINDITYLEEFFKPVNNYLIIKKQIEEMNPFLEVKGETKETLISDSKDQKNYYIYVGKNRFNVLISEDVESSIYSDYIFWDVINREFIRYHNNGFDINTAWIDAIDNNEVFNFTQDMNNVIIDGSSIGVKSKEECEEFSNCFYEAYLSGYEKDTSLMIAKTK